MFRFDTGAGAETDLSFPAGTRLPGIVDLVGDGFLAVGGNFYREGDGLAV